MHLACRQRLGCGYGKMLMEPQWDLSCKGRTWAKLQRKTTVLRIPVWRDHFVDLSYTGCKHDPNCSLKDKCLLVLEGVTARNCCFYSKLMYFVTLYNVEGKYPPPLLQHQGTMSSGEEWGNKILKCHVSRTSTK